MELTVNNQKIEMDGDGFMLQPELWNDEVAKAIAQVDDINDLTEDHWKVIRIIRQNYEEKGLAPMVRVICKETGLKLNRFTNCSRWDPPVEPAASPAFRNPKDVYNSKK